MSEAGGTIFLRWARYHLTEQEKNPPLLPFSLSSLLVPYQKSITTARAGSEWRRVRTGGELPPLCARTAAYLVEVRPKRMPIIIRNVPLLRRRLPLLPRPPLTIAFRTLDTRRSCRFRPSLPMPSMHGLGDRLMALQRARNA